MLSDICTWICSLIVFAVDCCIEIWPRRNAFDYSILSLCFAWLSTFTGFDLDCEASTAIIDFIANLLGGQQPNGVEQNHEMGSVQLLFCSPLAVDLVPRICLLILMYDTLNCRGSQKDCKTN